MAPNLRDLNPVSWLQRVGTIATEGVQNTHNWYDNELKQRLRTDGVNQAGQVMSSLRLPFVSGIVDSSRSVMHVLYTFSCNTSYMLLSAEFKFGEFGGHSWNGMNSGVSLCNINSTVARAQWAFQVSQCSVDQVYIHVIDIIQVRWKTFIILQQIYSGNRVPNFIRIAQFLYEILLKTFWSLFFWTQCIKTFN